MRLLAFGLAMMVVAIVTAACAEELPVGSEDAGAPIDAANGCADLEVGTGTTSWIPVADGDTLRLHRGPQGGYMLYLAVRARGLDPADAEICYTETFTSGDEAGTVFGEGCWRMKMPTDLGDGWYERLAVWGEVSDAYWISTERIRGQEARVDVTVSDPSGCAVAGGFAVHIDDELAP